MTNNGFTPLMEFWSDFFEMTVRNAPPPRDAEALSAYMSTIFGDLTEHNVGILNTLPFVIDCKDCKNNGSEPVNAAVCKTHVGVLKGVAQAMTHVPLAVSYMPSENGACSIWLEIDNGPDGEELVAHAKLLDHVTLGSNGAFRWLQNKTNGSVVGLTEEAYTVLAALSEERTAADLARVTGYAEEFIRQILDQCYAQNLVYCRFATQAEL